MSSPRRSSRGSGAHELAAKRQKIAQLQKQIAEERAAVHGAQSRTKELSDARRILEAADQFSRLSALIQSVRELPEGRGEALLSEHTTADRAQKARLAELEQRLTSCRQRQLHLQHQLRQLRDQLPPASHARQQLRRAETDPAVQREYTAMLQQFGDLTHLYNLLEKLMVTADYNWLESTDWLERIRPAYHALSPPSHLLRADISEGGSEPGEGGDPSPP